MASSALARGLPQLKGQIRFLDFAPDLDPITPGAIFAMGNLYPTSRAWRAYPGMTVFVDDPLPGKAYGAFTTVLDGEIVFVVGTIDELHILNGSSWDDQGITADPVNGRWRFDQYGGLVLAANGVDPPWAYDGTGTFDVLGGSPPAASIVQASTYSLFLIEPDSNVWWSTLSAILWTPSIATQTVTDALDDSPGNITAAHRLRAGMTLYKAKGFHHGEFIGPPFYWDFNLISAQVGAPCQEAIANLGDVHLWPGNDDFYRWDGQSLTRLPNNLKDWFFDHIDGEHLNKIAARWDQRRSLIFWHFPSRDSEGELDSWICLNQRTGKWGCSESPYSTPIDIPFFTTVETATLTYARLTTLRPLYSDYEILYGDLRSQSLEVGAAIRSSDKLLVLYNGEPDPWMLTTHDFGDYTHHWQITRAKPAFSIYPSSATCRPLSIRNPNTTRVQGPNATLTPYGYFDLRNTAYLQQLKIESPADAEIVGVDAQTSYAGDR